MRVFRQIKDYGFEGMGAGVKEALKSPPHFEELQIRVPLHYHPVKGETLAFYTPLGIKFYHIFDVGICAKPDGEFEYVVVVKQM